jgi:hypothetical protein
VNRVTDDITPSNAATGLNSGRMTLLLIAGIPVIVILASTWLWYFVANGQLDLVGALGTSNRGVLVRPPRQASEAGWTNIQGEGFAAQPPFWTLVVPQRGAECDAACEKRLYETRQIHMALGKEMGRAKRLMVTDAPLARLSLQVEALSDQRPLPDDFADYMAREQRGMDLWQTAPADFGAMFPEYAEHPDSWYLMDPAGWVMMRYDESVSYKDVIADLKFLIKNSNG